MNLEEFRKSKVWTKIFCKKVGDSRTLKNVLAWSWGLKENKKKSAKSGKLIKNEKTQKVDGKCGRELKGLMQK